MKLSSRHKAVLPHLIAYSLFVSLVITFFSPIFLEDKKLFKGDIPHHEGIKKQLIEYRKQTGKEPLWSQAVFSGMPAYLIDVAYQEPIHTAAQFILGSWLPEPVGYILASLICCYILLISLGINPYTATMGGLAYGFSTFTLVSIAVGHDGKVAAMAYMPLVLAGVHLAYHHNHWKGGLLTLIGLSLQISATHPQITYYLAILLLLYGANQFLIAVRNQTIPGFFCTTGVLLLAVCIALLANFGRLWTIYDYTKASIRGATAWHNDPNSRQGIDKSYAFKWSLGKAETMSLLVPNFYGGTSHEQLPIDSAVGRALKAQGINWQQTQAFLQNAPTYWGEQPFTEGPMYLGIIVCFLYLASFWVVGQHHRYWLITGTVLAVLLSWGKNFLPFNDWLYDYLPGYSKFRAVTTAIVLAQVTTVVGACLFVQKFLEQGLTGLLKKGFISAGSMLALLLITLWLFSGTLHYESGQDHNFPNWLALALQADRKQLLINDIHRALLLLGLVIMLFLLYANKHTGKKYRYKFIFLLGLMSLTGVDFYTVGKRYIREKSYLKQAQIDHLDDTTSKRIILQDHTLGYRVLDTTQPFTNGRTSYYYPSVGGYHGAKIRRYQDLIEYALIHEYQQVQKGFATEKFHFEDYPILNMLNTRYFINPSRRGAPVFNAQASGPAWFVKNIKVVKGPREALEQLSQVDLKQVAIVDQTDILYPFSLSDPGKGSIELQLYEPHHLQYNAVLEKDGFAVFSEIYYQPGWQAWVDGIAVVSWRVNYLLRALPLTAGQHTIVFKFQPLSYTIGKNITRITHLLLIGIIGIFIFYFTYRGKEI